MKCKNCGGTLLYSGRVYSCENCGNIYDISVYYESTDVYICYIESDSSGVRTKDSVLAQELYTLLESNKISSFYSRTLASNLAGAEFSDVCNAALHASRVVLIVGTQKAYFQDLLDQYAAFFKNKMIIPIYSQMDASDIPKEIRGIQALDYKKVGATADLIKTLLGALGREKEVDYAALSRKNAGKKRIILLAAMAFAILAGISSIFVIINHNDAREMQQNGGTHASNELQETRATQAEKDRTQAQYEEGVGHMENGRYASAIDLLYPISDYRNSSTLLLTLYEKYAGYYKDEESGLSLRLQVWEGNTCAVELSSITASGALCKITESALFVGNSINIHFNDSENNRGIVTLVLENESLSLRVETAEKLSEVYIDDCEIQFLIAAKSDKPFTNQLDRDVLLSFVMETTTLRQLIQRGYELDLLGSAYDNQGFLTYKFKNTDIILGVTNADENNESYIFAISAPAEVIAQEKIGVQNDPFLHDGILYLPDRGLIGSFLYLSRGEATEQKPISNATPVCFASEISLKNAGGFGLSDLILYYFVEYSAERQYQNQYSVIPTSCKIVEETETYYIVIAEDIRGNAPLAEYKVYKQTYEIEKIEIEEPEPFSEEFNAWCPSCYQGYFITGFGLDGLTCNQCGCIWLPMCYMCQEEYATSIMQDSGSFLCMICGEAWNP